MRTVVCSCARYYLLTPNLHLTESYSRPKLARGLTPPTLDENIHYLRCLAQLRSKDSPLEQNIYLGTRISFHLSNMH